MSFWQAVITFVLLGVFLQIFLKLSALVAKNKLGFEGSLGNSYEKTIVMENSADLFELIFEKINSKKKYKTVDYYPDIPTIVVDVGVSLKSFGEVIRITSKAVEDNKNYIVVTSSSKAMTRIDYGKNRENVSEISDLIFSEINGVKLVFPQKNEHST